KRPPRAPRRPRRSRSATRTRPTSSPRWAPPPSRASRRSTARRFATRRRSRRAREPRSRRPARCRPWRSYASSPRRRARPQRLTAPPFSRASATRASKPSPSAWLRAAAPACPHASTAWPPRAPPPAAPSSAESSNSARTRLEKRRASAPPRPRSRHDLERATRGRRHQVDRREGEEERDCAEADELRGGPVLVVFVELLLRELFGCRHCGTRLVGEIHGRFKRASPASLVSEG